MPSSRPRDRSGKVPVRSNRAIVAAVIVVASVGGCEHGPSLVLVPPPDASTNAQVATAGRDAARDEVGAERMTDAGLADAITAEAGATPLPIDGREALRRVADVLWQATTDPDLLTMTPPTTLEELTADVRAMVADPRASAGVGAFFRWWLWLDEVAPHMVDPKVFPNITPDLQNDMAAEVERLGVEVTLAMNGTFQTLMTTPLGYVTERLAAFYGVAGVTGDQLQQVTLPAGRPGVLTRAAVLLLTSTNTRTSVVYRGRFVDLNLFCFNVPAPPPGEPPFPQPLPPGVTGSAAMKMLLADGASLDPGGAPCQVCHDAMDPIGDALEGFDAIGRVRTMDNGAPIDTSPIVVAPSTPPNAVVDGVSGLVNLLSTDPGAERCMAKKWLSFALGRQEFDVLALDANGAFSPLDAASLTQIDAAFAASQFNLRALIAAVLVSPAFLTPDANSDAGAPPGP
jgi:hypothetical protein